MFLPDIFWQKKKAGVVNRPVMYPQSHVLGDASKSAVWEHPFWVTQGPDGLLDLKNAHRILVTSVMS